MAKQPKATVRKPWILVGMDFSRAAQQALAQARTLARERDSALLVLHVIDGHGIGELARLAEVPERALRDRLGRERRLRLGEALRGAEPGGEEVAIEPVIAWGRPFEEILKKAAEISATLIVLGTAGHSADLEKVLFGSTAEKVLRAAPCPVLCVPVE
ncbi:MAG: universal stress protein [Acidobacteria bacterium]|nr:universal stress protein [Acidobacteriota bacterium]